MLHRYPTSHYMLQHPIRWWQFVVTRVFLLTYLTSGDFWPPTFIIYHYRSHCVVTCYYKWTHGVVYHHRQLYVYYMLQHVMTSYDMVCNGITCKYTMIRAMTCYCIILHLSMLPHEVTCHYMPCLGIPSYCMGPCVVTRFYTWLHVVSRSCLHLNANTCHYMLPHFITSYATPWPHVITCTCICRMLLHVMTLGGMPLNASSCKLFDLAATTYYLFLRGATCDCTRLRDVPCHYMLLRTTTHDNIASHGILWHHMVSHVVTPDTQLHVIVCYHMFTRVSSSCIAVDQSSGSNVSRNMHLPPPVPALSNPFTIYIPPSARRNIFSSTLRSRTQLAPCLAKRMAIFADFGQFWQIPLQRGWIRCTISMNLAGTSTGQSLPDTLDSQWGPI